MISEEQKAELLKRISAVVEAEKELTRIASTLFRVGIRLDHTKYEEAEKEVNIANAELAAFIRTLEIQERK